ncbi:MAG: tRNA N6-adenosine threonylcarbamoyltransferase [Candidatus Berkelbacteria bacterium Licking1014_85]|uniref:tRNA N6-adenosine threonylcarbamoyltransferase n=1 Tax=Candidatus Berkelbacteria bacterium Licking1014_85 TaxID=2017148 RepID=A0A554LHS5_9BACT|nr:MAG: tRNA N6-adenosine threonylcarbamoyltransferase [Candidatus Berkelbacteria bacterium Licking1014_85]
MKILAIETSCDDTCVALLKIENCKLEISSNIVSSQVKLHAKYGGVYPSLAKREHQKNLPVVFQQAIKEAKTKKFDAIAVTVGPGLEPCLWIGVNFAKDLAKKMKLPILPINHIEAHIMANWIEPIRQIQNSKTELPFMEAKVKKRMKSSSPFQIQNLFPAVCLVVSGGHTQLILMKNIGNYKLIGETRDDAAGECFDKIARILGLGYPGGPIVAAKAAQFQIKKYIGDTYVKLPRPMMYTKDYDFSFSGLKTAVLYDFRSRPLKIRKSILRQGSGLTLSEVEASKKYIQEMCFEAQQAIIDVLIKKTIKAAKDYRVKSIILGGGVVANKELRKQFQNKIQKEIPNTKYLIPDTKYCTDNAAMVAATAYFNRKKATKNWQKIEADANLKIGK